MGLHKIFREVLFCFLIQRPCRSCSACLPLMRRVLGSGPVVQTPSLLSLQALGWKFGSAA